ncbi:site-specific integrase [Kribbella sp. VKM Ac-2568]|uniref:tyrosine-type recombinase/integrase n=1 Tax=Kribbella sp. VKM Ac-2568 TaxID=2512219 RepID=UPI0010D9E587|nr:site-specific integrase [Kribbella sp. VKM Ac-2568]TCM36930.1 site-specific recombinase XerD [Kribbella sp. VKM Ac-2568]
MPRPPLPIGTWGRIRTQVVKTDENGKALSHRAQAKYRDHDGQTRLVSAFGKTKTAAENNLLNKLKDRAETSRAGELTAMHRIRQAVELWEAKFAELVAEGRRSPSSLDTYRRSIRNHVLPALGELRIGEASTPRIDSVISEIQKRAGAPTARTCRSIISGVMGLAVRYGAITINPVREVDRIEHNARKLPRALPADEVQLLRKHLRTNERAARADLPDLVTFMLGTGVRIGEALAVLWSEANLDTSKVKISHTIVRVKREGLLRKVTKSRAGQRELGLPDWVLTMLRVRFAAGIRLDEAATLLAQVDKAAEPAPSDTLAWITSHAFRKTTATVLDNNGQSARQIADHLGHARVSMTQDTYLVRKSPNPSWHRSPPTSLRRPRPPLKAALPFSSCQRPDR